MELEVASRPTGVGGYLDFYVYGTDAWLDDFMKSGGKIPLWAPEGPQKTTERALETHFKDRGIPTGLCAIIVEYMKREVIRRTRKQ